eukprot:11423928-Ditylum_brightwellii.AAC.1
MDDYEADQQLDAFHLKLRTTLVEALCHPRQRGPFLPILLPEYDPAHLKHIAFDQQADWDETHPKCRIGNNCEYQVQFKRGEQGQVNKEGTYTAKEVKCIPKYDSDSCFLFGVAVIPNPEDPNKPVGRCLKPLVYAEKNVITHKKWEEAVATDIF